MHLTPAIHRLLAKAASLLLLLLLFASEGAAATFHAAGKPCNSRTTSIGRLLRQARSVGGPVARRVRTKFARLRAQTTHVERGIRPPATEDSEAIQNDAPAAHAAASPVPSLQVLGRFVDRIEILPCTASASPQSPRGPPVPA